MDMVWSNGIIELFLGKRFLPNIFGAFLLNLCIDYLDLFYMKILRQCNLILLSGYLIRASFSLRFSASQFVEEWGDYRYIRDYLCGLISVSCITIGRSIIRT